MQNRRGSSRPGTGSPAPPTLDRVILPFGTRAYIDPIVTVTFVCAFCGLSVPQQVYKRVNRFTLFFLPLFTVSRRHFVECSNCGNATALSEDQAHHAVQWAAARS